MSRSFLASLLLLLASPLLPAAEGSAEAPGILLDRVVAIVNDGIVTQSELDEAMNTAVRRLREARGGAEMPPLEDIRRQVMDQLILNRIQSQRAERIGITVDEDRDHLERMPARLALHPQLLARAAVEGRLTGRQGLPDRIRVRPGEHPDLTGGVVLRHDGDQVDVAPPLELER